MRKTSVHVNPDLWDEKKDSYELAKLMGVTPNTIRVYARRNHKSYKMRNWGAGLRNDGIQSGGMFRRRKPGQGQQPEAWRMPDETRKGEIVKELLKQWRLGDDRAGKELLGYGIKAKRCDCEG